MKANKQIMKISFFIAASALIVGCATAQKSSFNQIDINGYMRFKGRTITGISNDSAFTSHDSMSLPTAWAVYNYFKNRAITGISTNHPYVVSSQSAMLALSANVGDVAIRTDESKSYILQNLPADSLSNWIYMPSPIPSNTDLLSEGTTNKYYTDARVLAYVTGKNISLFNNDLNFTQRSELVDSAANLYKTSTQIDSFSYKINKTGSNPGTVVKVINIGGNSGSGGTSVYPSQYTVWGKVKADLGDASSISILSYDANIWGGGSALSRSADSMRIQLVPNTGVSGIYDSTKYIFEIQSSQPGIFYSYAFRDTHIITVFYKDASGNPVAGTGIITFKMIKIKE